MNDATFSLAESIISPSYARQAQQARRARESLFKSLLAQRRLPKSGWDEGTLRLLLQELALMDSNTFVGNTGVGEREARVACNLVAQRHFGLGHGIGRSGDIAEEQPKAAGSSLLYKLTNSLAADALRIAGATGVSECLVLPVATGMSVTLTLLALRKLRPEASYVVWPRIDQKSCLKAVSAAGATPIVVENVLEGDELRTDVEGVRAAIERVGAASVLCVLSTTSCFAPLGVEKLLELSRICEALGVAHVANNAYGVQCRACMKAIASASRHGRLDAFIQSSDKNFLVPVGGACIASCSDKYGKPLIAKVSATYPGRASVSPILDLFCTLLSLGADGWTALLDARHALLPSFRRRLASVAEAHGERLLATPNNSISMAVSLTSGGGGRPPTAMGASLWVRLVSGARIVAPSSKRKEVAGVSFANYGSHCDEYPTPYFTVACALGVREDEVQLFLKRLDKTLREWKRMKEPEKPAPSIGAADAEGRREEEPMAAEAVEAAEAAEAAGPAPDCTPEAAAGVAGGSADGFSAEGFSVVSESSAYRRYLQVEDRLVRYPDGREARFDIVGHPSNGHCFVTVFAYCTASATVTMLREFAQAAPPHGTTVLGLPCGGYDPGRHSSMLHAAQLELSEEARLRGGSWHPLLPDGHPGILEAKWCRNRFTPFLCIDPVPDDAPGARDAEEHIEVLHDTPLRRLREAMAAGELLLPSMQTCFCALEWLRREGRLPASEA